MQFIYIFCTILIAVLAYFYMQLNAKTAPIVTEEQKASGANESNGYSDSNRSGTNNVSSVSGSTHNGTRSTMNGSADGLADNKQVLVLFGSQTGTAEMFAKTLVREGGKLGVPIRLCDVEEYDCHQLEDERLVIVVCATYGEGEPTDSMKNFHEWLMDDMRSPGEELHQVQYAVFGLGDKQYKYFCEEGVAVDRRLNELGATRIYGAGCGDAGGGQLEEQFDEWRKDLWPAVSRTLHITLKVATEEPVEPECRMKIWTESEAPLPFPKTASVLEPTQRIPVWVPMTRNEELLHIMQQNTPSHETSMTSNGNEEHYHHQHHNHQELERSTRAIEFHTGDTIISYQAGDHLGILPCNTDAMVQSYLDILQVSENDANVVFSLQNKKTLKNVFPARVRVWTALKWYIDLSGPPKKSTLRAFAHCCEDAKEKDELLQLLRVNPESQREYARRCSELRNMLGFLRHFSSAKVPLSFFLEMMPRITPRYFSISSDLLDTPTSVGITVAIVQGGLCTNMLLNMKVNDKVPVFVRKSNFHLPLRDKERPIIMIGPGTGVAPFIGFIRRRKAWKNKNAVLGKAILFFGCRRPNEDYVYEELFQNALTENILTDVYVAFSRAQAKKVYVQHLLHDNDKMVWETLYNEKGNLYVCGDARRMAKDVEKELILIAQNHGSLSEEEALNYLKQMEDEGRYLKDVWTSTAGQ